LGQSRLDWFIAPNFRMNEFSGGVLLAQLRKLDMITASVRSNARYVYEGIRDLPGLHLRHLPDRRRVGERCVPRFQIQEQANATSRR
jgi:dTDP-4-amino-4,6-dideoxygalactose transaminase